MRIAVEGCAHGELEKIYDTIGRLEQQNNYKVDLLLCCGDFQATRNLDDLNCMAIPAKFHDMCSFYKYYSGEKVAPILTIFIGGNHEASNYLQELPYGGWVAPNIYYMGYAGVVNVNGIRIAGVSGIYKGFDFYKGHFEYSPFDEKTKRSVYHLRQLEVFRMKQLSDSLDIVMSHDWPRGVYNFGNAEQLMRFKPHFREEIYNNSLGSPPCEQLLNHLKPNYWFSAHLHCKFSAVIPHENTEKVTKFLSLDKCLPKRRFLQLIDMDGSVEAAVQPNIELSYDLEWLTILYTTRHLLSVKNFSNYMPGPGGPYRWDFVPTDEEKQLILARFNSNLVIPKNFCRTAEPYTNRKKNNFQPKALINPQTTTLCDILGIDDPVSLALVINGQQLNHSSYIDSCSDVDSSLNTTDDIPSPIRVQRSTLASTLPAPLNESNPDELDLDDEDELESDLDKTPNIVNSSSISNTSVDLSNMLRESAQIISPSSNAEKHACETEEEGSIKGPAKKFKRRNQSIYGNTNED